MRELLKSGADGIREHRVPTGRWRSAQLLELDFWTRWETLPPYRNLDIPAYWQEEVARFGETWACFDGLRVLDVGCGPYGLIHFVDRAAERIRVDPLLPQYPQRLPLDGRQLSVAAMAESLPLATESVDLAICHNALDHMWNPVAGLEEIARVLRPGGTALLMIHTFPGWLLPLYWVDRIHPHHYTAAAFRSMVGARLRIEHFASVRRHFQIPSGSGWVPSYWKYRAGSLVVSSTYIRATAPTRKRFLRG